METNLNNLYNLDGKVPVIKAIPFGLQHVLAMFVSNITPIIILASVIGVDSSISASLIQNCMIIAGIGTLVQLYPVWRIGARLPIVMGISFTFLALAISIASAHGMGTLMGAVIVGGLIEGTLGLFVKYWVKLIPPVVAATVVIGIGFSLLPIAANSFAGGQGASDFGSWDNWLLGTVTLTACLACQIYMKGVYKSLSILFGLIVGYILALYMGMVDYSALKGVGIISLPNFLPFTPKFDIGAIISITAIFLVSATETIGDTSALCAGALKRTPTNKELGGAICCDGYISSLAGLFGCTPITSFSQNVGLVAMSGVVNRFTISMGAIIMILGGIFPVVGTILTTIPQPILGGCVIMMFGSILYAGMNMLAKCEGNQRNMLIVSISLSVGLGFTTVSNIFNLFPEMFRTIFANNCVGLVFLLSVFFNLVIPKNK